MTSDRRLLTDTERLIQRELERLPLPKAPETLLPRVMAAVQAWAERPWYTRAWFSWPAGWQIASSLAFVGVIAALVMLLSLPQLAAAADIFRIVTTALRPFAVLALPFVLLMGTACIVFASLLNQIVFGKALHR